MVEDQLELLERSVLHAQRLESQAVNLRSQILQQKPALAVAAVHHVAVVVAGSVLGVGPVPAVGAWPAAASIISAEAGRSASSAGFAPEILSHRGQVA